ncbi:hypothetical protein JTB14_009826 [Gonioctena quinquepunctata]|nr:hypothetical protein JTB14_009826 [Gonioctena quinquepunctata]
MEQLKEKTDTQLKWSAIGALLYLSVNTRPDICVATSILGRNVSDPYTYDWSEEERIMKYLNETIDMEIKLGKISSDIDEDILYGYADADWAGDRSDRKSNSGYLFKFMGAMFDWRCKKQTCVALSSTEAEFIPLSEASQQSIYLKGLLQDLQQDVTTTVMFQDNQSCLKLLDNEEMSDRTKHIETKYNFVKDLKLTNKIIFQYCPSHSMLADFLTKPLLPEKLRNNIEMVGEDELVSEHDSRSKQSADSDCNENPEDDVAELCDRDYDVAEDECAGNNVVETDSEQFGLRNTPLSEKENNNSPNSGTDDDADDIPLSKSLARLNSKKKK